MTKTGENVLHAAPTARYVEYQRDTECFAPGCTSPAEFEVYLYDLYLTLMGDLSEEFFKQDFTCPYLCHHHMSENERDARGVRQPRGYVAYPFTNRGRAQGYTKYAPVTEVFPELFAESDTVSTELARLYTDVNDELIARLAQRPELMRELAPRRFEELVAELFNRRGYHVTLTPATRDGGVDIYALSKGALGESLYVIECKRYAPSRRVGVDVVRGLYAVAEVQRATKGILVTTSGFTKDAIAFASPLEYRLSLQDFDALKTWLAAYRR